MRRKNTRQQGRLDKKSRLGLFASPCSLFLGNLYHRMDDWLGLFAGRSPLFLQPFLLPDPLSLQDSHSCNVLTSDEGKQSSFSSAQACAGLKGSCLMVLRWNGREVAVLVFFQSLEGSDSNGPTDGTVQSGPVYFGLFGTGVRVRLGRGSSSFLALH